MACTSLGTCECPSVPAAPYRLLWILSWRFWIWDRSDTYSTWSVGMRRYAELVFWNPCGYWNCMPPWRDASIVCDTRDLRMWIEATAFIIIKNYNYNVATYPSFLLHPRGWRWSQTAELLFDSQTHWQSDTVGYTSAVSSAWKIFLQVPVCLLEEHNLARCLKWNMQVTPRRGGNYCQGDPSVMGW